MRLRQVSPDVPGWTRRRCGRGFRYLAHDGTSLGPEDIARCKALVIPPAWTEVWICPFPNGHLQAVGVDEAGRRQYLYHPEWRDRRDREKHDRVVDIAGRLPAARRTARRHLGADTMTKDKALATAFLLLDLGVFRVGGEEYTARYGSYGLATVEKRHVTIDGYSIVFDYPAKSSQRRRVTVTDRRLSEVVGELLRRRGGGPQLLAYRDGRRWRDITSRDIGDYVKRLLGADATSKDFRTWHATVEAAAALAAANGDGAPRRAVKEATDHVAEVLGDTPAVARSAYIDPRVIEHFEAGETIDPQASGRSEREEAVAELLTE
jgi:DNA topoisomerase IB